MTFALLHRYYRHLRIMGSTNARFRPGKYITIRPYKIGCNKPEGGLMFTVNGTTYYLVG